MSVAELTCRHCSTPVSELDRFCKDCGARLENSIRLGSPLLESRKTAGIFESPLFKAEVVLLCALGTFAVSAAVWTTTHNSKPVAKESAKLATPAPISIAAYTGESEVSRLMRQAKQFRISEGVANRVIVRAPQPDQNSQTSAGTPAVSEAKSPNFFNHGSGATSPESKSEPAPELKTPVKVEPAVTAAAPPAKQASPVFNPPAADEPERIPSIDEQLERDIPAVKKGAGGKSGTKDDVAAYNRLLEKFFAKPAGTVDGVEAAPALEPPTYEEWIAAGKPQF